MINKTKNQLIQMARNIFEGFNPSSCKVKDKHNNYTQTNVHNLWIGFKNWYIREHTNINSDSIKQEVGDATWDSWTVGSKMAIEQLEVEIKALRMSLNCQESAMKHITTERNSALEELKQLKENREEHQSNVVTTINIPRATIIQLEAEIEQLKEYNARHTLNAIKRICPKCGDDMCGDNHDVCYKCLLVTAREAIHEIITESYNVIGEIITESYNVIGEVGYTIRDIAEKAIKETKINT